MWQESCRCIIYNWFSFSTDFYCSLVTFLVVKSVLYFWLACATTLSGRATSKNIPKMTILSWFYFHIFKIQTTVVIDLLFTSIISSSITGGIGRSGIKLPVVAVVVEDMRLASVGSDGSRIRPSGRLRSYLNFYVHWTSAKNSLSGLGSRMSR